MRLTKAQLRRLIKEEIETNPEFINELFGGVKKAIGKYGTKAGRQLNKQAKADAASPPGLLKALLQAMISAYGMDAATAKGTLIQHLKNPARDKLDGSMEEGKGFEEELEKIIKEEIQGFLKEGPTDITVDMDLDLGPQEEAIKRALLAAPVWSTKFGGRRESDSLQAHMQKYDIHRLGLSAKPNRRFSITAQPIQVAGPGNALRITYHTPKNEEGWPSLIELSPELEKALRSLG